MRTSVRLTMAAIVFMALGALVPTTAMATGSPTLVASGFDNPRGVAFFHDKLVVGEAGHGGPRCIPASESNPLVCFGRTGQISWVNRANGSHTPLVSQLFSSSEFLGGAGRPPSTLGVSGLSDQGSRLMAILGVYPQAFENYPCAPGDQACADDVAAATEAGALLSVKSNGSWTKVAGVGAFDYNFTADKTGHEHDANPYDVFASGGRAYVADAGANTLDAVGKNGNVNVIHWFPQLYPGSFPSDEVPTCIVRSEGGFLVGTLAGNLFRVRDDSAVQVPNTLLKHVTGCTSRGENVYFVNMWTTPGPPGPNAAFTGDIVQFNADEGTSSVIAAGLNFPNKDVVGPDQNLYFSANSICPSTGPGFCTAGGTVWKLALGQDNDDD